MQDASLTVFGHCVPQWQVFSDRVHSDIKEYGKDKLSN